MLSAITLATTIVGCSGGGANPAAPPGPISHQPQPTSPNAPQAMPSTWAQTSAPTAGANPSPTPSASPAPANALTNQSVIASAAAHPQLPPPTTGGRSRLFDASAASQSGTDLFFDDFERGSATGWSVTQGDWRVAKTPASSFEYAATSSDNATFAGDPSWSDIVVEADIRPERIEGSRRGTALLARVVDANHFYQIEFANESDGNRWELWRNDGGNYVNLANGQYPYVAGHYYRVQLRTVGSSISVSLGDDADRTLIDVANVTDSTYARGRIGARIWGDMASTFDNVRVRNAAPVATSDAIAAAGTQPFPNSPFDVPVTDPKEVPNSYGMISRALAGNWHALGQMQFSTTASGPTDGAAPVYIAHQSDPHYRIHCRYYSNCPLEGADVAIPRGARPAGNLGYTTFYDDGSHDQHLAVRNVDTQIETDMWLAPQPSDDGGTLEIGYGGTFPFSSSGVGRPGATATGFALAQGRVRPVDLIAGHLPTALNLVTPCANGHVEPAINGDGADDGCPPLGAHVWLDSSPDDIARSGSAPDVRAILGAMHEYGGYIVDRCSACSLGVTLESGLAYTAFGRENPWVKIAAMHPDEITSSPNGIALYHIAVDSGSIDLASHLHVIR